MARLLPAKVTIVKSFVVIRGELQPSSVVQNSFETYSPPFPNNAISQCEIREALQADYYYILPDVAKLIASRKLM